jgi:spore germination cell wall hydrolase CwlJ-like protein
MQFLSTKRVGAGALATIVLATGLGLAASGATAQDQAEQPLLESVQSAPSDADTPTQPEVRFVAEEVVQALPAQAEDAPAQPTHAASLRELVASMDASAPMSREVMCLAQAVYYESRGEPLEGQLAVARVIVNRAESGRFPEDYCAVVAQPGQFSFVRGGSIPMPNTGSVAWQRAQAIARIAHRDLWHSAADDSLYFHATHVRPSWAGRLTARATISRHVFYR